MKAKAEDLSFSSNVRSHSADILSWKEKYRNIYYLKIRGNEYIFRLLTRNEFSALCFSQDHFSGSAEDTLLRKCVLYPQMNIWDDMLAGEVECVFRSVLKASGFGDMEDVKKHLDKEREAIKLLDNQFVVVICKAFPHITPSEIENFDYPTIIHYVALAEEIIGTKLEINKLEDPSKPIDFNKDNREHGFGPKTIFPQRPTKKRK